MLILSTAIIHPVQIHRVPAEQVSEEKGSSVAASTRLGLAVNTESASKRLHGTSTVPSALDFVKPTRHFPDEGNDYFNARLIPPILKKPVDPPTRDRNPFNGYMLLVVRGASHWQYSTAHIQ